MKLKPAIFLLSTFFIALSLSAEPSRIKENSNPAKKSASRQGDPKKSRKSKVPAQWNLNNKSVVKIKGVDLGEKSCQLFNIQFSEKLSFKIECGGFTQSQELLLNNSRTHTVTRKSGYTTITKYGYLIKKPQTSQLDQSTLRVPFVSQIIHISQNEKNELAFYLESFKVDEFGRIVQDQFVQAHSLSQLERKVSVNSLRAKKN